MRPMSKSTPVSSIIAAAILFSFVCGCTIVFTPVSADDYDYAPDEVEYFDSTQSTSSSPRNYSKGEPRKKGIESVQTTVREVLQKPQNQIGTGQGRRPPTRDRDFKNDGGGTDRGYDFEFGFFGPRRNEFVEVRIGEFSAAEQFARVYGKLTNYTNSFYGESLQVSEFLGVPFAEPCLQHLRFQRPTLKTPPDELFALRHPEPCPQISESTGKTVIGNEDCLHLSIYVPGGGQKFDDNGFNTRPSKMPVLVWFHGENPKKFYTGKFSVLSSGSSQDLDPFWFLQNKIIVVTPQYRLGSLGFLSVANEDLNGNMGLLDQVTALEWVQRYISYFGGDSNQVTVMGQGSSATALGLLGTSTASRSLYHRMILMSGSPSSPLAFDTNQKITYLEIARQNSCPSFPTLQLVRCMKKKGMESIVQADEQLTMGRHLGKFRSPLAVIQKENDGRFLPPLLHEDPLKKISKGQFHNVPVIIGVTSFEMSGFLSSLSGKSDVVLSDTLLSDSSILRQYIREVLSRSSFSLDSESVAQLTTFEYFAGLNISERQEQAKDLIEEMFSDYLFYIPALTMANAWSRFAPVYFYVYDYVQTPTGNGNAEEDVSLKNGNGRRRQSGIRRSERMPSSPRFSLPSQAIHGSDLLFLMQGFKGSAQDRHIASIMVDAWTSFIHKGSPLQSGLEWPTYGEDSNEYLFISDTIQIRSKFRARQEQFWTQLLKELGQKVAACPAKQAKTSTKVSS